ncbi:hypothetical protein [Pedobacter jamesrossensis]|uniref:Uncharacterized protein n=1 Tax=Pedobacter jamesrossensis TaxID=1908238 RepID=A0ABV8NMH9_9SPHI
MKNSLIIALLCLFFLSCKKDIPEPDVVRFKVYSTKIKYANNNEPDVLFWYVWKANKGGYFYITSTSTVENFSPYNFSYCKELPSDIKNKSPFKNIVVWINQLNGDLYFDIMGKNSGSNTAE